MSPEGLGATLAEQPGLHYLHIVEVVSRECDVYLEECTFVLRVAIDTPDSELQRAVLRYDEYQIGASCLDFNPARVEGDLIAYVVERGQGTELLLAPCMNRMLAAEYARSTFVPPAVDAGCASCEAARLESSSPVLFLVALAWMMRVRRQ